MFSWLFKKKETKKETEIDNNDSKVQTLDISQMSQHSSQYKYVQTRKVIVNGVITEHTINTIDSTSGNPPSGSFNSLLGRASISTSSPNVGTSSQVVPRKYSLNSRPPINSSPLPITYTPQSLSKDAQPFKPYRSAMLTTPHLQTTYSPSKNYLPAPSSPSSSNNDISNAKTIKVKQNGKYYDNDCKIPTYSTHGPKRGNLLIINNIMFRKVDALRKGARVDEQNIKKLFKALNFNVESYNDLKKQKMVDTLKKHSKKSSLKSYDINVVLIMSHGHGDRNGVTQISGSDDELLDTSTIIEMFNNISCPHLKDKPKIFIFQCCRGDQAHLQNDGVRMKTEKKVLNDMLLAYSTIPGFVSHRDPNLGTWYIQAICEVFMEHACDTHIEDMLKIVEAKITELAANSKYAQTTSYENRGFKRCFLHP